MYKAVIFDVSCFNEYELRNLDLNDIIYALFTDWGCGYA